MSVLRLYRGSIAVVRKWMPFYQMFWITTLNSSEFNSCLANESHHKYVNFH